MAIQVYNETELAKAQQIIIAEVRFTAEFAAPCPNLVEHFTLGKGEKRIDVPKVGQMEASALSDGVDLTDSEAIGMSTTSLTTGEVGLKAILTNKLVRQEKPELYRVIGRQMGEAMARKKDKDIIALFDDYTATDLGATGQPFGVKQLGGVLAYARAQKFPRPYAIVHHPNTVYDLVSTITITPAATYPIPRGYAEDMLKDFFALVIDKCPIFSDGNIATGASGADDAFGAIFSKSSLCLVESLAPTTEREYDASLRATEVIMTADYGCFVLDDSYGATLLYDAAAPATTT